MVFSAIGIQDRFEIQDALSRFCHAIDRNDLPAWRNLFRVDAEIIAPRLGRFEGLDAICGIPDMVAAHGGGAWRHYFINVAVQPLPRPRAVQVDAYCMVSNWRAGGQIIRSWDFRATLVKGRQWQFTRLCLTAVPGSDRVPGAADDPASSEDVGAPAGDSIAT
jgi:hypothetical protein